MRRIKIDRRARLSRDDVITMVPAGVFDSIAPGKSRAEEARGLLGSSEEAPRKAQEDLFATEGAPRYGGGSGACENGSYCPGAAQRERIMGGIPGTGVSAALSSAGVVEGPGEGGAAGQGAGFGRLRGAAGVSGGVACDAKGGVDERGAGYVLPDL